MKILIAFYSRTGATEKVAEALKKELAVRGHSIDIEKVKPTKELGFWGWWNTRMLHGECDIQAPKIWDVSKYDAILIGSPNWTRLSLPVARYLREIEGLRYKKVGFFATTALPSVLEWFFFSAYLLDLTFSTIIEKKGGRIVDSILLSSVFKRWSLKSQYGGKTIKKFCNKLETPIRSLKEYFLEQKEIGDTRILVLLLSFILFFSLVVQIVSSISDIQIITWSKYASLFFIGFFAYFVMLMILAERTFIFWGKYLTGISLVAVTTSLISFLPFVHARSIILGYILVTLLISFFRNPAAVLSTGLFCVIGYTFLFFNYPLGVEFFIPPLDLSLLFLSIGIITGITHNLQKHFLNLLTIQDEIEVARAFLEVKIEARTQELRELAGTLDEQVKKRTWELQEKIEEMEKFQKLAVGRELKMIELKEEIKKLKKELEKY